MDFEGTPHARSLVARLWSLARQWTEQGTLPLYPWVITMTGRAFHSPVWELVERNPAQVRTQSDKEHEVAVGARPLG